MLWIIVFALIIIGALAVLSFALHLLFSPWLLLLAAGVLVWLWVRPRRSRRTYR
jgi:chromate transport protein ChrA